MQIGVVVHPKGETKTEGDFRKEMTDNNDEIGGVE